MSPSVRPRRRRIAVQASTGPSPITDGIERRPLAVDDAGRRRQVVPLHRVLRSQDHPRGAVGDLRAVAGRHLAPGPLERGLQLAELLDRGVGPHAVVEVVDLAAARKGRLKLPVRHLLLLRGREPVVALGRVFVGGCARDVERRCARISAVWPMLRSTTGSVRPRSRPITGLRNDGRKPGDRLEPRPRSRAPRTSRRTSRPRLCGKPAARG